ncbi:unnamed protein product [Parnassius mnemosyne]|uniref:HAT C-terminal dimerisation domain-containing protein n=1 Tax=Parnassius mnemosyne TaxID=213953 RepID=A0AAV1LD97_9NEOP
MHFKDPVAKSKVFNYLNKFVREYNSSPGAATATRSDTSDESDKDDSEFDIWKYHKQLTHKNMKNKSSATAMPLSGSISETEVQMYLSSPVTPIKRDAIENWKDMKSLFPKLTKVAMIYLPIVATSVPKEKEEIERLPLSKKAKVIIENRRKTKERVRKHRLQKKQNEQTNTIVNESSIRVTPQSIGKAVVRARNALPACPIKKQLVLGRLLDECPKESPPTMHGASGLDKKVILEIQTFYQRDDISHQAPGLKDYVTVRNERGEKEKMQIRHLFSSVTEFHIPCPFTICSRVWEYCGTKQVC